MSDGGDGNTWDITIDVPDAPAEEAAPVAETDADRLSEAVQGTANALGSAKFEGITQDQQSAISDPLQQAGSGLLQMGMGGVDPRFEQFRQSQLSLLGTQQQQQQARQSEFFNRRGMSGSSAALNRQTNLGQQFGQQEASLSSQIGLQGIAQQQQNISQGAGLLGQSFGVQQAGVASRNAQTEQGLEALAAQVETLAIPEQLRIALLAAITSGTTIEPERQKFLGIF